MEEQENITPIDQYIIDYVLTLRTNKDLSQQKIADLLGVKRSFIGNIESTNSRAKYNPRHINILADYFDLSPRDFLPAKPLEHFYPGREKSIKPSQLIKPKKIINKVSPRKTRYNKKDQKK